VRFEAKRPIGVVDCVRYSFVYSTHAIGMVVGAHFLYYNDKFFGLARSDYINVLGKGYKENGQRKVKDKSKRNWPYASQPVKQP
jgi:hypothetical protein